MSDAGEAAGECVRACVRVRARACVRACVEYALCVSDALILCVHALVPSLWLLVSLALTLAHAWQRMGSRVSTPTLQGSKGPKARKRVRMNAPRAAHMRSWGSKVHKRTRQKISKVKYTVNILGH